MLIFISPGKKDYCTRDFEHLFGVPEKGRNIREEPGW
jgi:hypothetical protein